MKIYRDGKGRFLHSGEEQKLYIQIGLDWIQDLTFIKSISLKKSLALTKLQLIHL